MKNIHTTKDENKVNSAPFARQRIALVFVNCSDTYAIAELCELAHTAGGDVVITYNQNRPSFDTATLIGSGKVQEIAEGVKNLDIDVVIFNDELTPTQHRNIQEQVDCVVLDRIGLILDIFAMRAKTAEGKLQVELAQLKYTLPKLRSVAGALTRQGGAGKSMGIGTRGPGETKMETDRRHVHEKITKIKQRLDEVAKQRNVARASRIASTTPIVALVGYTNAGKSTLFNRLTNADLLAEDMLFATLDTTARKTKLNNGLEIILTDTVGFIQNLPHDLIEAFKSTLEETTYADIVLNVCDVSKSQFENDIAVTQQLLKELDVHTPIITVYNKIDNLKEIPRSEEDKVYVSAKSGDGIDNLLSAIEKHLSTTFLSVKMALPYSDTSTLQSINKYGQNVKLEYTNESIIVSCILHATYIKQFTKYLI